MTGTRVKTEDLVRSLAAQAPAVARLQPPFMRAATWLGISAIYAALVVAAMGLRPDIAEKLTDSKFALEVGAAVATSVLAAIAAFCAGTPGRPRWERFAPVPALAVWLASLGTGCWQSWVQRGPDGLSLAPDLICFPSILSVALVPGIVILVMVRRGAPIAPATTTMLAALASASLGAAALRLFHMQDASVMVLVWQLGSVAVLTLAATAFGARLLRWPREATINRSL